MTFWLMQTTSNKKLANARGWVAGVGSLSVNLFTFVLQKHDQGGQWLS